MSRYGYRLFPVSDYRLDPVDGDRCAEHSAVEDSTYRAVRTLPHLVQVVLGHALCVRCDRGTLYSDSVFLDGFAGILCDLVTRLIADRKTEVIVFRVEVDERQDELILDHLPEYPCHFIPVHLNDRGGHSDSFHYFSLYIS